ncbi:hypothetical protein [Pseudoroseomonas cervicalis]|uniref:hypothetical protein n=1 Tax=Teichococcus cervicalis TaxID=204525 RepID=UPI0022F1B449|nr:hypothetical protein [Pseudoroseomonas cervicalis]WBV43752.1 hypothetical protein PFY06_04070 [Pseudoroseomonas cervicalis]
MASVLPRSVAGDYAPPALVDQRALLMMLSYVEAECRRLGAMQAAEHAAAAAAHLTLDTAPQSPLLIRLPPS